MNAVLNQSLSHRVIVSALWVSAIRAVHQVFSMVRLFILARILAPDDFGLLGFALLTLGALETFSQTGFDAALIQRKGDVKSHLDSAWTVLVLRGIVLCAVIFSIAPYAALFFDAPEARPIVQVIGFSVLLKGFVNIGIIYYRKEFEFNKQFVFRLSATMADFAFSVSAALLLRNAWALVIGLLAGNLVEVLMSYIIHSYRPRLSFDFKKARELWGFGRWVLGSSILTFLVNHGNDIAVGKMLGTTALGFYLMAHRISITPFAEIGHVVSQVMFPAYSKLQNDTPRLREAFLRVTKLTALLSMPIAGLMIVLAPDFTRVFLGEKWLTIMPVIRVLALAGLMRSIAATFWHMFYAIGKPKIDTAMHTFRLLILGALVIPFTLKWSIMGASMVAVLSISIPVIVFSLLSLKISRCGVKEYAGNFLLPLISISVAALFVHGLKDHISVGAAQLATLAFAGVASYLMFIYFLDKLFKYGINPLIRESISPFMTKR